ncbi:hypothetical protein [Actinokineospora bangkokensis]|uniref:hypothetical protein n=1 Tax=Actinokineospora bangkokensis TaxID=1193682 RepID=UPI001177636A|nr:hypothetical protein [Actinokineospora bangkokensis]
MRANDPTPSSDIGNVACSRVFHGGCTLRLAKGDDFVAVFRGTCVEQRRFLVLRDRPFPGPVKEGPQRAIAAILRAGWLCWSDHRGLAQVATAWTRQRANIVGGGGRG